RHAPSHRGRSEGDSVMPSVRTPPLRRLGRLHGRQVPQVHTHTHTHIHTHTHTHTHPSGAMLNTRSHTDYHSLTHFLRQYPTTTTILLFSDLPLVLIFHSLLLSDLSLSPIFLSLSLSLPPSLSPPF